MAISLLGRNYVCCLVFICNTPHALLHVLFSLSCDPIASLQYFFSILHHCLEEK